jgi:hypothetical protein
MPKPGVTGENGLRIAGVSIREANGTVSTGRVCMLPVDVKRVFEKAKNETARAQAGHIEPEFHSNAKLGRNSVGESLRIRKFVRS